MSIEHFRDLIEIQSLDLNIKQHLDKIEENRRRILFIKKEREKKELEKNDLLEKKSHISLEISKGEKELFDLESKLESSNRHMINAKDSQQVNALTLEVDRFTREIDFLQGNILELMESQEELDNKVDQIKSFISGSLETLHDIESEVEAANNEEELEIGRYQERIKLLRSEIKASFLENFDLANKKHRYQSPLSPLNNGECGICRNSLDRMTEAKINSATTAELCPACYRLLFPISAKS